MASDSTILMGDPFVLQAKDVVACDLTPEDLSYIMRVAGFPGETEAILPFLESGRTQGRKVGYVFWHTASVSAMFSPFPPWCNLF